MPGRPTGRKTAGALGMSLPGGASRMSGSSGGKIGGGPPPRVETQSRASASPLSISRSRGIEEGIVARAAGAEARAQGKAGLPEAGLIGADQILRPAEGQAGCAPRDVEIADHLDQCQPDEIRRLGRQQPRHPGNHGVARRAEGARQLGQGRILAGARRPALSKSHEVGRRWARVLPARRGYGCSLPP